MNREMSSKVGLKMASSIYLFNFLHLVTVCMCDDLTIKRIMQHTVTKYTLELISHFL